MHNQAHITSNSDNKRVANNPSAQRGDAAMAPPSYGIDLADSGRESVESTLAHIYKGVEPVGSTASVPVVQTKLSIGEAGDQYEQEADRVADQVMRPEGSALGVRMPHPHPSVQRADIGLVDSGRESVQSMPSSIYKGVEPVGSTLAAPRVQAKLSIGEPDDEYEQEADRVADQVMHTSHPSVQLVDIGLADSGRGSAESTPSSIDKGVEPAGSTLAAPHIQAKLSIGEAGDEYEQEADRVADQVMRTPHPSVQLAGIDDGEKPQAPMVQAKGLARPEAGEQQEPKQEETDSGSIVQRQLRGPVSDFRVSRSQAGGSAGSSTGGANNMEQAADFAVRNKGPGESLSPSIRGRLEAGIGTDLSKVRIHSDSVAHSASSALGARAFTHRNDIWLGRGESPTDLRLMAHESTHVAQQTGGVQRLADEDGDSSHRIHRTPTRTAQQHGELNSSSSEISSTTPHVQRIGNPFTAITDAVGSAAEWVGDSIDSVVDVIKERAAEFVRDMPGYSLFTVVYGSDPITGRPVERNGRNFIEAGLDVIPNGEALKQKLEQEGALDEAVQWLDHEITELDFNPTEIANQFTNFWSSLSISDVTRIPTVMNRLVNIILEPLGRIRRFAVNVASQLLQIVKDYVISSLINFVREHTNAYPLMTVILGRDPISGEAVERTPIALLRGFMQLSESGQEQLRQMEESGSLQRAATWLDGAVARLNISWEVIRDSFTAAWNLVTIENLLDPIGTFRELYNIFAEPVGRIINFVIEVSIKVLGFIKDALISRLTAYARTVRGYPLISVILGKDPISQDPVERNTGNIIHGFMSLMENGEQQYQEMVQSGAIARMSARVEAALVMLNFTWEYISGLFTRAWNSFTLVDLAAPFEAFGRLMQIFAGPIMRLVSFVAEIIKVVIEVLMEVMNFPIDLIRNIISRAMQAIEDIKRDPMGFLKNLLRAVKTGFQQFFNNILQHLLNGITGWLFSEMRDANINPPADLSFQSILGFVLEVLGITVERIWEKLAERIGEERVAQIRGMIDRLTGIWTFVKDVATRGPVAIWEYIQERLSNLWGTVLEAVRNWVVTRIVQRVTARLLSMLDPTGIMAVINGFVAFYSAVQSFIRYMREMLEIVNSFVVGVAELARGNVSIAADFLEGSLARAMPVAIGFLANQVGLSGIGRRIGEMIERVRGMVDQALTWLVDRAVSAGSSLLNMGRSAVAAVRDWWSTSEPVTTRDGENHEITFSGSGAGSSLIIRSTPTPYDAYLDNLKTEHELTEAQVSSARAKAREIDTEKRRVIPESEREEQGRTIHSLVAELATITRELPLTSSTTSMPPVYGPEINGFGSLVTISRLTDQHGEGRSPTIRGTTWNNLVRRKEGTVSNPGGRTLFVRGHLLNDNLGGPGNTWSNLTPLTQTANNSGSASHLHGFETPVKTAVDIAHKTVDFRVTVEYGRQFNSSLHQYFSAQGNSEDNTRAQIVEAEQYVPRLLHCSSYELTDSGSRGNAIATHRVDNTFTQTPDGYPLSTGVPKEPVYLMEMDKDELMALNGIGEALADSIIAAKPFRTKAQLQESAGIASGIWARMQSTPGKIVRLFSRG